MSVRIANVRESPHKTIEVLVVIVMLLIALPSALSAQQELPEPKPLRFDLTPFIGYRTSMSFPIEPHVTGTNPRVVLDASPSYGVSLGMRLANEGDLVEMRWARQDSYVHAEDITPQLPRQRVILDQFHGDFSHETPIEDWASWARPFVLASVGATHVSGSTNISFTRFSFGIGGRDQVLCQSPSRLQDSSRMVAGFCGSARGIHLRLGLHRSRRWHGKFSG